MYVVVAMAGYGERFRAAGYRQPKYAIEVRDRSLLAWSQESLRAFAPVATEWIFVARREAGAAPFVRGEMRSLGLPEPRLIELESPTDGQATTVMRAAETIADRTRPLLVYNIDTYVEPGRLRPERIRGDGWIPCFDAPGDGWSFARVAADGTVTELREKQRISEHASIGLYWFSSLERFVSLYERTRPAGSAAERRERYVAPLYNTLIADGGSVYVESLPPAAVHPLGTPEQLAAFAARARGD